MVKHDKSMKPVSSPKIKTVVAGALGECVHVAGVSNFLRLAGLNIAESPSDARDEPNDAEVVGTAAELGT